MENMLEYKGKPLVRSGNTLYYGNPAENYVAMLKILTTKEDEQKTAERVLVQILSTDETLPPKERVIKKTEKTGLYEALHIASIWLERSLNPTAYIPTSKCPRKTCFPVSRGRSFLICIAFPAPRAAKRSKI